jgi:hypothetical protein
MDTGLQRDSTGGLAITIPGKRHISIDSLQGEDRRGVHIYVWSGCPDQLGRILRWKLDRVIDDWAFRRRLFYILQRKRIIERVADGET